MSLPRADARYHGDRAATPGMLDFAVDVRAAGPPSWLVERLSARLDKLAHLRPTLVEAMREAIR